MFGSPYLGRLYRYSSYISGIHSRPVCLLSSQKSRVHEGKLPHRKRSNLPHCDIAQSVYRAVGPILAHYIWAVSTYIPDIFRWHIEGQNVYNSAETQGCTRENAVAINGQTC